MSQQQTLLRVETNIPSSTITGATNYEYLDLYEDIPIKINKSFSELQDISTRNSDYSVNLLLPGSKKNNRFFESFYDVDIDTFYFNPNFRVECKVIIDSKSLFSGYLRLNKISIQDSKVEYDVTLFSNIGNLFGKIGNNLLKDLNFSDSEYTFNHTFGRFAVGDLLAQSNFFKNDTNPYTYFYPIVHNGYNYESISGTTLPDFTGATVSRRTRLYTPTGPIGGWSTLTGATSAGVQQYRINSPSEALYDNQLKPALNIYSLIQLIFKTYGYTISSDFFNTPWMKTLYMYGYFSSDATKFGYKIVTIDSFPIEGVELIYSGSTSPGSSLNIIVCKRDTGVPCFCLSDIPYAYYDTLDNFYTGTIAAGLSGRTETVANGFSYGDEVQGGPVIADVSTLKYAPAAVGSSIAFVDGDPVNFSLVIDENIKQIDLLSSIAKKFNLIFVTDPNVPNQIIIEPFDFFIGTGDIWDWTDKISYDGGFTIEPALNYVESELTLTDLEDSDEGNKEFKTRNNRIYGRSKNPNPTDFKSEEKKIETIFSPQLVRQWDTLGDNNTSLIGLPLGINYAATSEISSYDNQVRWIYNGIKTKPKLFFWLMGLNPFIDSVDEVFDMGVYNTYSVKIQSWTGGTAVDYDRIPSVSHTMPMGLEDKYKINNDSLSILFNSEETVDGSVSLYNTYTENSAYNTFYKNRITNIYNPNTRFLSGKFNLDFSDISNLKANDVIRLKNQYFIINKISEFNYTNRELTEVELLQFNVNPQNYPTRYFKYYYCENPDNCFVLKTDFNNPNLRGTNFIWSLYYDNQVGSLTGITSGFTSSFKVFNDDSFVVEYFPYTMQEITEAEYNSTSCYDYTEDPLMQFIYQNPNGPIFSLAGFWENSSRTKTGVNVWRNCADFTTTAINYSIITGTTTTYGTPGYCFNNVTHFTGGPAFNSQIHEIKEGVNGNIFAGGANIDLYNGASAKKIIKIYNNGIRNYSFDMPSSISTSVTYYAFQQDANNRLYVGGNNDNFWRLNQDGSIDTSFNGGVSGLNSTGVIYDIEFDLNNSLGNIFIAGTFTSYNGTARVNIAKINTDGTLDTSFNSYFASVSSIYILDISQFQTSVTDSSLIGKIVVGGLFSLYSGQSRNGIVVLNTDGTLYTTFNPGSGINGISTQVLANDDGTILLGGIFTTYSGVTVPPLIKLNIDGTINNSFNYQRPPYLGTTNTGIGTFAIQSDGKILALAQVTTNGVIKQYIIRLNTDGSTDNSFRIGTINSPTIELYKGEVIEVLGDDSFYVGGNFTTYSVNGETKTVNNIVKLNKDGDFAICG